MKKESSVLKYTAILMIVFGAVETAIGIRGLFDISALHDAALALQLANPVPTLIISGVFTLLIAVAELVAGILGYLYRARPKKAGVCILSGIAVLSLTVLFNGYVLIFYPTGYSALSLPVGVVLPAVYLFGAYRHKKSGAAAKKNPDKQPATEVQAADTQTKEENA